MAQNDNPLETIGRLERIDFPEWNLFDIEAKVDTGAYTSSLHCHHIKAFEKDNRKFVKFNLLDPTHETYNDKLFQLPVHRVKVVKSSNGTTEERYIIKTEARLFDQLLEVELSLTDRSEMRYPVLLGRKLINGRFVVDVSQKHLSSKNTQEK